MDPLYLALGDSITKGYGVGVQNSFATLYFFWLKNEHLGMNYRNLGINGLTSANLLKYLYIGEMKKLLSMANIITITIGANDLLNLGKRMVLGSKVDFKSALYHLRVNIQKICYVILNSGRKPLVQIAGLYNPFKIGPFSGYGSLVQPIIDDANHLIYEVCQNNQCLFVPLQILFKGKERWFISQDHIHPSFKGHRVIAKGFIDSFNVYRSSAALTANSYYR